MVKVLKCRGNSDNFCLMFLRNYPTTPFNGIDSLYCSTEDKENKRSSASNRSNPEDDQIPIEST